MELDCEKAQRERHQAWPCAPWLRSSHLRTPSNASEIWAACENALLTSLPFHNLLRISFAHFRFFFLSSLHTSIADAGISLYALAARGNNKAELFTRLLELASFVIACPHTTCSSTPCAFSATIFWRAVDQFPNIGLKCLIAFFFIATSTTPPVTSATYAVIQSTLLFGETTHLF